jgi:2-phospho-L-lactate guanylyltransferase
VSSLPSALVRLVALVPVRGLEASKSRLGEALDAEERRTLVERLLARTVTAAAATPGVAAVAVVSPDPAALDLAASLGALPILQSAGGLNEGLAAGRDWLVADGADALLIVPADLPGVSAARLATVVDAAQAAAGSAEGGPGADRSAVDETSRAGGAPSGSAAPRGVVVLVTDRAGDGTNALLLAPPDAIPFRFGPGSRAAHAAASKSAGAAYVEVAGPLDLDLDTPDDLLAAEAHGLDTLAAERP